MGFDERARFGEENGPRERVSYSDRPEGGESAAIGTNPELEAVVCCTWWSWTGVRRGADDGACLSCRMDSLLLLRRPSGNRGSSRVVRFLEERVEELRLPV